MPRTLSPPSRPPWQTPSAQASQFAATMGACWPAGFDQRRSKSFVERQASPPATIGWIGSGGVLSTRTLLLGRCRVARRVVGRKVRVCSPSGSAAVCIARSAAAGDGHGVRAVGLQLNCWESVSSAERCVDPLNPGVVAAASTLNLCASPPPNGPPPAPRSRPPTAPSSHPDAPPCGGCGMLLRVRRRVRRRAPSGVVRLFPRVGSGSGGSSRRRGTGSSIAGRSGGRSGGGRRGWR